MPQNMPGVSTWRYCFGRNPTHWLVLLLAGWAWPGWAQEATNQVVDAKSQERVVQLLQTVIDDYWDGPDAKSGGRTNTTEVYTNIEMAFRAASTLTPNRLDLRFGIASSLVLQGLQTNGPPLQQKVKEAFKVYREIQALNPNGFEAAIWYAAYARALGETNESQVTIDQLMATYPERTREYLEKFTMMDHILEMTPNDKPCKTMPRDKHHAIVILGAGLETNGTLKLKLTGRLKQGLKLARIYRTSPIILTGGNQKAGVTEAYVMKQWLEQQGISRKRLFVEDQSKDTVENALFSCVILKRLRVTHVTVVTSSSHLRRGLADLEEACSQRGLNKLEYAGLAAVTKGDKPLDKEQERVGVYRDVMRISGLWSFPGLRR